jgi:glycopeptide antibiotics resistance protein
MGQPTRRALVVAAAVVLVAVLAITLFPVHVDGPFYPVINSIVTTIHDLPGMSWFNYNDLERVANAILFFPIGVIAQLVIRRWWLALAVAAALSGAIELAQLTFLPGRTASLKDVAANTAGAAIGILLTIAATVLSARSRRSSARG